MITTAVAAPTHAEAYRMLRSEGVPYREAIVVVSPHDLYRLRGRSDLRLIVGEGELRLSSTDMQFLLLHIKEVTHE